MENLTAEQILEGNRAIAEFLELKMHDSLSIAKTPLKCYEFNYALHSPHALKFHSSWSWLMPVVEKISRLHLKYSNAEEYYYPYPRTFGMLDEDGNFMVRLNSEPLFKASTLIEATYLAVLHIVEWLSTPPIKTENP